MTSSGPGEHERDRSRIAFRLSGRILWEQIVAFFLVDFILLFFICLAEADLKSIPIGIKLKENLENLQDTLIDIPVFNAFSLWFFVLVIAVEIICLIVSTVKLRRTIRKQLEPLRELRVAADTLSSMTGLSNMTDALSRVSAKDMEAHFAADSVSEELRPLVFAIEDMLRRLEAAYASQAKFVSDASHELRTPIAVIQGYANMLARWGTEDPETLKESVDAIRSEAESMKQLVNQLLFLARGDNDRIQADMQRIDLASITCETVREMKMTDETHEIRSQISEASLFVMGDAGLIKQLLRILTDNSIKYTPMGGEICVALTAEGEWARISVTDEGQGIAPELLPRIFDRFVRADEARTRNSGGAGLGLSIAKQIVDRHGGRIEVLSREGIGSRFSVLLRVAAVL